MGGAENAAWNSDSRSLLRVVDFFIGITLRLGLSLLGVGFATSMALLSTYPSRPKTWAFLALYFAFFGVVVQIILELGHFYDGLGAVTPESLEYLLTLAQSDA